MPPTTAATMATMGDDDFFRDPAAPPGDMPDVLPPEPGGDPELDGMIGVVLGLELGFGAGVDGVDGVGVGVGGKDVLIFGLPESSN